MLKKGQRFEWREEHSGVVWRLKGMLTVALALQKVLYKESPTYVTVRSPMGSRWVINQEDEGGMGFAI